MLEEEPNNPPVRDLMAGINAIDAALCGIEKFIAGSKEHDNQAECVLENSLEPSCEDVGDGEEEGISSSVVSTSHQSSVSNRTSQLKGRNRVLRRRNQLQKNLENALPLAAPDQFLISEEKSFGFAASFFMKVRERYEAQNNEVFSKFLELMQDLSQNSFGVSDLYHQVIKLFEDSPDLCEEFLLFFLPKDAFHCGRFMEHLAMSEMLSFLRKLELVFAKQPQHLKKIHASIATLAEKPDVKLETVRNTVLPLLRANAVLVDSFIGLLPSERPPESKMTDFDQVVCEDMDSEHSGEEEPFERIEIPNENDQYGGESCQCCCHNDKAAPAYVNRLKHCVPCGIKFMSGKVFMQTEHGLRPVRINFSGNGSTSINIKRLNVDHHKMTRTRSRRGRTTTVSGSARVEEPKQTIETDDEAIKVKSPRQRPKIARPMREKSSSAKSLSLSRSGGARRPAGGKSSTSPTPTMVNDQEAMAAPDFNEEEKPPTLNFLTSNIDQEKSENEDLCLEVADPTTSKEFNDEDIKEECETDSRSGSATEHRQKYTENIVDGEEDVKEEDLSCENVSPNEKDEERKDPTRDQDTGNNQDSSTANSDSEMELSSDDTQGATWTREEDRIILCTFQSEPDREKVLNKISIQLPHRPLKEISSRIQLLMSLIQQMR